MAAFAFCALVTTLVIFYSISTLILSLGNNVARGIELSIGESDLFHTYKEKLYMRAHLIRIGVRNNFRDKALTNCKVKLNSISGEFSNRMPIVVADITSLNPRDIIYVNFASLDEENGSIAYDGDKRKYGIQVYFPINPLPSDKSNWLDNEPYEIELLATAAECPPFAIKCKLWVDGGRLKLMVAR